MIIHGRRRRQFEGLGFRQEHETVITGGCRQRWRIIAPIGNQLIQGARFQHGAREDMRADLTALFNQAHRHIGRELFQADGGGKAGRPTAHDQHIKFHRFPFFGHTATPFPFTHLPM